MGARKNYSERWKEAKEVYQAIKETIQDMDTDHCQSWWLNKKNHPIGSKLTTAQINTRARMLVKEGYLEIDRKYTKPSCGTCYRLTNKRPSWA